MAIWTTTDRDQVKAAILALATGARVASTEIGGKTREYNQTNLPALEKLLATIVSDIDADAAVAGYRRVRTTVASDTW